MGNVAHSRLSASGSSRWLNCPGSVKLSDGIKDESSFAAKEGTVAHKIFEEMTTAYFTEKPYDTKSLLGSVIDEITVDLDMIDGATLATNEVIKSYTDGDELYLEERVDLFYIHKEMFGTSDVIIKHKNNTLTIIDFKYGKWPVDPKENSQLMYYFLGARQEMPIDGGVVKIVQPRSRDNIFIKQHEVTRDDYLRWEDIFKKQSALVDIGTPLVKGSWCRFCLAKNQCPLMKT